MLMSSGQMLSSVVYRNQDNKGDEQTMIKLELESGAKFFHVYISNNSRNSFRDEKEFCSSELVEAKSRARLERQRNFKKLNAN